MTLCSKLVGANFSMATRHSIINKWFYIMSWMMPNSLK